MGYKKEEQKVQSYVFDGELFPMTMDKIMHKPLGDYLTFIVGKDDHI